MQEKMPQYPKTPMRNCLYCKHYNSKSNTCTAPNAEKIANFYSRDDVDCILFKYDIAETPKTSDPAFTKKFCVGKKCPFYYETLNLCTRPSKCPYVDEVPKSTFESLDFDKEI